MPTRYAFDRCQVRPAERQVLVDGAPAALGARAFDLLVTLIERRDRVVDKSELFDSVWPGLVVEENEPIDEAYFAPRIAASQTALGEAAFDAAVSAGMELNYEASINAVDQWLRSRDQSLNHRPCT